MVWIAPSHVKSDRFPKACWTMSPATPSLSWTLTFCDRDWRAGTVGALQVMWTGTPTAAPRASSTASLANVTVAVPPAAPAADGSEAATATVPSETAPSDATKSTPFLRLDIWQDLRVEVDKYEHRGEERVRARKAPPRSVADEPEPT